LAHKLLYLTTIKELRALRRGTQTSDHALELYVQKMLIRHHLQLQLQIQKPFI